MPIYHKYTKLEHIGDAIRFGVYASRLKDLNDPYEFDGILYPDDYRVCSMSSAPLKMLMWSHYATHRGCRIDFEVPDTMNGLVRKVRYDNYFTPHEELDPEQIIESLYSKGKEWEYEDEVRAVWNRKTTDDYWAENEGKVFLNVPVKSVAFGLFAEKSNEYANTLRLIEQYNREREVPIEVKKVRLKTGQYQLMEDRQFDYRKDL